MARSKLLARSTAAAVLAAIALTACSSEGLVPTDTVTVTDNEPPATNTRTRNPPTEIPTTPSP